MNIALPSYAPGVSLDAERAASCCIQDSTYAEAATFHIPNGGAPIVDALVKLQNPCLFFQVNTARRTFANIGFDANLRVFLHFQPMAVPISGNSMNPTGRELWFPFITTQLEQTCSQSMILAKPITRFFISAFNTSPGDLFFTLFCSPDVCHYGGRRNDAQGRGSH